MVDHKKNTTFVQKIKQMKKFWMYRWLVFCWVVVMLLAMPGCRKDHSPDDPIEEDEYAVINDWILENMKLYYFWNTQIPRNTDKTLYPKDYFESLLYKKEDRFSWIQEDFLELMKHLSGVTTEAGYEFDLFVVKNDNVNVYGYIAYIKPGTPAEKAGLQRGDIFSSINGITMTRSNYQKLLGEMSKKHTIGKMIFSGGAFTGQTTSVSLDVVEYEENPILLDTIYYYPNHKIGYLVYNLFSRDSEPYGIAYEKELNDVFGKYKSEGVNELIIDLRYNSGGTVVTAEALASMISNRGATDVFGYEIWNSIVHQYLEKEYGKDYNKTTFPDNIVRYNKNYQVVEKVNINKLNNLNRVHFIVTRYTASASELVINCLKPYMEVVLIGSTTYGKNVGSITIWEDDEEKQKTNTWGIQPIVLKLENSEHKSDYGNGFKPDIEAEEFDWEMRQLGDTEELMLSAALNNILGGKSPQKKNVSFTPRVVGSSLDRNTTRKNMYIDFHPKRVRSN